LLAKADFGILALSANKYFWKKEMGKAATTQALSYPLRLPDEVQADALRLLDCSRDVINTVITTLWDRLDEFGTRSNVYAYKQVEEMIDMLPVYSPYRSSASSSCS
jgi:hypothetical protein